MFDLDLLVFLRAVDAGSLAAAARVLEMSAPMASRRLTRLEQRVGVPLAHRTSRRFLLTAHGERFYRDVADLEKAWHEAEGRLRLSANVIEGSLRISAPTSFGRLYVASALRRFLDRHPLVTATLDLSDGYVDLIGERYDMAIRITARPPVDLRAEWLAQSLRVLCASPAYIERFGMPASVDALGAHRWLAADGQLPWRLSVDGHEAVVSGQSEVRTNSSEVVRELALAGMGIALRSLWDVHGELEAGRLIRVLPGIEGSRDNAIYAVYPRKPIGSTVADAFGAYLLTVFTPSAPWEQG